MTASKLDFNFCIENSLISLTLVFMQQTIAFYNMKVIYILNNRTMNKENIKDEVLDKIEINYFKSYKANYIT